VVQGTRFAYPRTGDLRIYIGSERALHQTLELRISKGLPPARQIDLHRRFCRRLRKGSRNFVGGTLVIGTDHAGRERYASRRKKAHM
jgi:hypothetical protein